MVAINSTYGGVDKSEENDGADDGPDGLGRALLETLRDDLVEAVTHAAQLRRKSTSVTASAVYTYTRATLRSYGIPSQNKKQNSQLHRKRNSPTLPQLSWPRNETFLDCVGRHELSFYRYVKISVVPSSHTHQLLSTAIYLWLYTQLHFFICFFFKYSFIDIVSDVMIKFLRKFQSFHLPAHRLPSTAIYLWLYTQMYFFIFLFLFVYVHLIINTTSDDVNDSSEMLMCYQEAE